MRGIPAVERVKPGERRIAALVDHTADHAPGAMPSAAHSRRGRHKGIRTMALPHAAPGEPLDVRALGETLVHHKTAALFKSQQLEVIRLVRPAGKVLPPHKVPGEITIQCI